MSAGDGTVLGELTALRASATAAASHEIAKGDAIGVSWQNGVIAGLDASRSLVGETIKALRTERDLLNDDGSPLNVERALGIAYALSMLSGVL